jgi:micrococcal nuclease
MALLIALLLTTQTGPAFKDYHATLVSCYDGDTCDFDINLGLDIVVKKQRVRFCDINAPEIRPLATREAATKVKDDVEYLIKRARSVLIRIPQKRDCDFGCDEKGKYGRWLGYIIIDGTNLNQTMLDNGWVTEWKEKCI